jgi:predicted phosphate transport protein (TIGR00153 family)
MGAPTWSWISRRVEREVLKKALEHIEKVSEVAAGSVKVMEALRNSQPQEVLTDFNNVDRLEGEADEIKRRAIKEMSEGFIHPIDREELMRLILVGDDIAAYLKAASRRATMIDTNKLDPAVKEYALRISEKVAKATSLLKNAIEELVSNPKRSLELADEVERIEEEVDDLRDDALREVMKFCDRSSISACIVSKEIIDSLENSSDRCEDVADVIRSIAVMRM